MQPAVDMPKIYDRPTTIRIQLDEYGRMRFNADSENQIVILGMLEFAKIFATRKAMKEPQTQLLLAQGEVARNPLA